MTKSAPIQLIRKARSTLRLGVMGASMGACLGIASFAQAAEPAPTPAQAASWAATCANCHGTQGRAIDASVPLAGYPAQQLFEALKAFQEGKRVATIMHQLSKGYSDDQLHAIAAYFEAQKK